MSFETLFGSLYPHLVRYLEGMTGDGDLAQDLAQEAFLRLWERGPEGPETASKVWLFRVATNLARDQARMERTRHRILGALPSPPPIPSPEGEVERRQVAEAVHRVLKGLSPRDRALLLLRHEGFTYREVAEAVGVAPGSVGTLLARAQRRFVRALETGEGASKRLFDGRSTDTCGEEIRARAPGGGP